MVLPEVSDEFLKKKLGIGAYAVVLPLHTLSSPTTYRIILASVWKQSLEIGQYLSMEQHIGLQHNTDKFNLSVIDL